MHMRIVFIMLILTIVGWSYCVHAELTEVEAKKSFPINYSDARKKFIEASRGIGAQIESFRNPEAGPEGEQLYTDVALIGPKDAKAILVLGSGAHGVEGFAGSGIQTGLLHENIASSLKPDMSILMIHAINPYGFAHLRRFNEDNVDVNRNFVDHTQPYPANQGYEELSDAIFPKSISFWTNSKSYLQLLWYRLIKGKSAMKKAITEGQYKHPKGLFYGGQSETWSNRTIRTIASSYLSKAEQVIYIGFHTGLGPYGNAEIILNERKDSPSYGRAVDCWGDIVKTTFAGDSVSAHLQGSLKLAFPDMLPNTEVTAVSLEFGTFSQVKVFLALRAENWLHHNAAIDCPDAKKIKAELLKVFYPNTDDWMLLVWRQGKNIVEQALIHLH